MLDENELRDINREKANKKPTDIETRLRHSEKSDKLKLWQLNIKSTTNSSSSNSANSNDYDSVYTVDNTSSIEDIAVISPPVIVPYDLSHKLVTAFRDSIHYNDNVILEMDVNAEMSANSDGMHIIVPAIMNCVCPGVRIRFKESLPEKNYILFLDITEKDPTYDAQISNVESAGRKVFINKEGYTGLVSPWINIQRYIKLGHRYKILIPCAKNIDTVTLKIGILVNKVDHELLTLIDKYKLDDKQTLEAITYKYEALQEAARKDHVDLFRYLHKKALVSGSDNHPINLHSQLIIETSLQQAIRNKATNVCKYIIDELHPQNIEDAINAAIDGRCLNILGYILHKYSPNEIRNNYIRNRDSMLDQLTSMYS